MPANDKNMSTNATVEAINKFITDFLNDANVDSDVFTVWEERGEEFKKLITKLTKTTRAKKPKDAPKNAKSGYMFFCQEMRAVVKEQNPDLSSKEITTKLGALWKETKETEDAEKYSQMADADKDRYKNEMASYVPSEVSESEDKPEKGKKKRAKKAKDAPKNAKSGYMFFCQEMRAVVKEQNPDLSSKEITTKLGALWKEIKETDEVKKYAQLSLEDKDRYKNDMASYVPSENSESEDDKPEKGKKKRAKKAKDAPKNAKSGYLFFCQEMRAQVKEENPDISPKEITTKLGAMWKEIKDTDEVKKYFEMSEADKDRYKNEMENYVPSENNSEEESDNSENENSEKTEKKKRAKKAKDAPKNAKSGYLFFCQEMRDQVKEENPDISPKEITTKLGAMWKEIKETDEVKKYVEMSEADKDRYKNEMENYVPSEGEKEDKTETKKTETKKTETKKTETKKVAKKVSNEDLIREIIEACESESITMKLIKDELKKKGVEVPKDELKKIIAKINEDEE